MSRVKGFEVYEIIGVGIPNPRSVTRIPVPPDLTPDELAELECTIDQINSMLAEAEGDDG